MTDTTLSNPLDRLSILPNTVNWRGTWEDTTQYYLNDIVVSPITLSSYILTEVQGVYGGLDPSLNPVWTEFSGAATGVQSVTALLDSGIIVTGTTNVTVVNDGVVSIGQGAGISVTGDPHNPVITNTGITSVVQGSGIAVSPILPLNGGLIISNTGVLNVRGGAGINVNPALSQQNPTITNTGVLSVIPGNAGIGVSAATGNITLTNEGVLSVTAAPNTGISITPTIGTGAITVANTGVLSVTGGTGVSSTGGQNPTLSAQAPQLIQVCDYTTMIVTNVINASGGVGTIVFTPLTTFAALFTGTETGILSVDLSRIILAPTIFPSNGGGSVTIRLTDSTHSLSTVISTIQCTATVPSSYTTISLGTVQFDIAGVRALGLTAPDGFSITNNTSASYYCTNITDLISVYYPLGFS